MKGLDSSHKHVICFPGRTITLRHCLLKHGLVTRICEYQIGKKAGKSSSGFPRLLKQGAISRYSRNPYLLRQTLSDQTSFPECSNKPGKHQLYLNKSRMRRTKCAVCRREHQCNSSSVITATRSRLPF